MGPALPLLDVLGRKASMDALLPFCLLSAFLMNERVSTTKNAWLLSDKLALCDNDDAVHALVEGLKG